MDALQYRYNCLELAHRIKPGTADLTKEAQAFLDFVEGDGKNPVGMVLIDRDLAEKIAGERDDMVFEDGAYRVKTLPVASYRQEPEMEPV